MKFIKTHEGFLDFFKKKVKDPKKEEKEEIHEIRFDVPQIDMDEVKDTFIAFEDDGFKVDYELCNHIFYGLSIKIKKDHIPNPINRSLEIENLFNSSDVEDNIKFLINYLKDRLNLELDSIKINYKQKKLRKMDGNTILTQLEPGKVLEFETLDEFLQNPKKDEIRSIVIWFKCD